MNKFVYIAFGSNLGDRKKNIKEALALLNDSTDIEVLCISSYLETEPVGGPLDQNRYINGVLKVKTDLSAQDLLGVLNSIEDKLGRVRTIRNGPRTIDLDILLYGEDRINTDKLTVPHPRMLTREFVLRPLLEIDSSIFDSHCLLIPHKDNVLEFLHQF